MRGADRITPSITDLNNGVYETKFIAMQPGHYKAEIVLESTLCEAFKDPTPKRFQLYNDQVAWL